MRGRQRANSRPHGLAFGLRPRFLRNPKFSSHLLRSDDLQTSRGRCTAVFVVYAADQYFIAGRKLLFHGQFVFFQHSAGRIHVRGLKLDLIISKSIAVVAESDDPRRFGPGKFGPELCTRDHDVALCVGAAEPGNNRVAVAAESKDNNNCQKNKTPCNYPLPRPQEFKHYCFGASRRTTGTLTFRLLRRIVTFTLSPGLRSEE